MDLPVQQTVSLWSWHFGGCYGAVYPVTSWMFTPGVMIIDMPSSCKLSASSPPENRPGQDPKGKDRFATIHFHMRDVSFREGICFFHWVLLNEWTWTTQPPWIVWLIFGMSHIARGSLQCFRILVVLHSLQQPFPPGPNPTRAQWPTAANVVRGLWKIQW